ncbi:MAG: hypothetical protein ACJASI_001712 [Glaciecola sp.]|jgi:hypothetical protein
MHFNNKIFLKKTMTAHRNNPPIGDGELSIKIVMFGSGWAG